MIYFIISVLPLQQFILPNYHVIALLSKSKECSEDFTQVFPAFRASFRKVRNIHTAGLGQPLAEDRSPLPPLSEKRKKFLCEKDADKKYS